MLTPKYTFLPPLQWGGAASNKDSGRREITNFENSGSLEKLSLGTKYSYDEVRLNDRPPSRSSSRWTCEVGSLAEIVVPAGKTMASPVVCSQDGTERLLVNYAPSLGYIVRHVLVTDAGPVIRELTGFQRAGD